MQKAGQLREFLMTRSTAICILVAVATTGFGQDSTNAVKAGPPSSAVNVPRRDTTYVIEPNTHPGKVIPAERQFQFPEFREGRIYFTTGKKSDALLLNYNLLYDAILLIDSEKDTVWLDRTIVEYVQIDSYVYFCHFNDGYFRLLTMDNPLKLMIKSQWVVANKWPLHSHWRFIESPQKPMRVEDFRFPTEYTRFAKARYYSFQGPNNEIYQPAKQSLTRAFPEKKKAINKYVKQHKIDFTRETDLKAVVAYCNALVSGEKGTEKGHANNYRD